jgi:hypothetical protein
MRSLYGTGIDGCECRRLRQMLTTPPQIQIYAAVRRMPIGVHARIRRAKSPSRTTTLRWRVVSGVHR